MKFDSDLRVVILTEFLGKLRSLGYRSIAASIGDEHLHVLAELPHDLDVIRRIMGKCKQRASHAVSYRLPGSIWSSGGEYKWIKDERHFHNVYGYVRTKQEPGTIVWSHRDDENWIDRDVPVVVMKCRSRG